MPELTPPRELAVVMPVYNEEGSIAHVLATWRDTLGALGVNYEVLVFNDGSRDGTAAVLAEVATHERIRVVNKPNAGHGPTILMGYAEAVKRAAWVFQCDSDDEMLAEDFHRLWERRADFDALFGIRAGRQSALDRRIVSWVSRQAVRVLFGSGVRDVNVPYRLMRAELLAKIVAQIPADTFAPNVIIAGAFSRARVRLANIPVPHHPRRAGTVSIDNWKLWKCAARSLVQTLRCRPRCHASR